ncbi:hypothetical protein [Priestia megaterium]|uniref:hypothetical protein n=1 Tax=Priestia megaterium TaxID=1404 RepID=UPI0031FBE1F4
MTIEEFLDTHYKTQWNKARLFARAGTGYERSVGDMMDEMEHRKFPLKEMQKEAISCNPKDPDFIFKFVFEMYTKQ